MDWNRIFGDVWPLVLKVLEAATMFAVGYFAWRQGQLALAREETSHRENVRRAARAPPPAPKPEVDPVKRNRTHPQARASGAAAF